MGLCVVVRENMWGVSSRSVIRVVVVLVVVVVAVVVVVVRRAVGGVERE